MSQSNKDVPLWGFGLNRDGQLMSQSTQHFRKPNAVGAMLKARGVAKIAVGRNFTVLLQSNGEVRAAGSNSSGQLGVGTSPAGEATKECPSGQFHGDNTGRAEGTSLPMQILSGTLVADVACGAYHTLLLTASDEIYSFGSNVNGELGLGAGELGRGFRCRHQTTPVLVTTMSGKGTKEVSCGEFSSYAVTREGEFWAWGGNTMGQLGLGHTKSVDVPQVCPWLPKEECIRIAAGGFHTVLLCAKNRVFSFGQNDKGVLGNGQRGGPECWTTPQLLEPLLGKGISDIKCGTFHGVALGHHQQTGRSRVYTWGWNSHGQLGLAGLTKGDVCIGGKAVEGLLKHDIVCIATGAYHTMAVTAERLVFVWGDNRNGQLGIDSVKEIKIGDESAKTWMPVMVPHQILNKWEARPGSSNDDQENPNRVELEVEEDGLSGVGSEGQALRVGKILDDPPNMDADANGDENGEESVRGLYRMATSTTGLGLPNRKEKGVELWAWAGGSHSFVGSRKEVQANAASIRFPSSAHLLV